MLLLILGIILLIAATAINKQQREELHKVANGLRIGAVILIILGVLTSCIKQIDAGQIGVKSLFGKVDDQVLTSGLNVINPLVDVKIVDIKTQNYTMSGIHDEGDKAGDDAIRVLTADGLEIVIDLTVLYRVISTEAPRIVKETGLDFRDKIVRPLTRTKIRDNSVYLRPSICIQPKGTCFRGGFSKALKKISENVVWCWSNYWFVISHCLLL